MLCEKGTVQDCIVGSGSVTKKYIPLRSKRNTDSIIIGMIKRKCTPSMICLTLRKNDNIINYKLDKKEVQILISLLTEFSENIEPNY